MKTVQVEGFTSFAKTLASLQQLTRMESAISAAIDASRVPATEVRKLLKCSTAAQAANTPLYQFMRDLVREVGLGHIELQDVEHFKHVYLIKQSPVAKLYTGINNRRTCYITADTLNQMFQKDMSLPCTVEETHCVNAGDDYCVFEVNLQPLAVYQVVLDKTDREIVNLLAKQRSVDKGQVAEQLMLEDEELDYRLDVLQAYYIIDDAYRLTKIGRTYHEYGYGLMPERDEDFPPPWETMQVITEAISSATSFAEAISEAADKEPVWEVDEDEVVNLADEARKSQSFAELLSKQIKKM